MSTDTRSAFTIRVAHSPADLAATKDLFRAYHAWLDLDLTFQDFETEISSLPGKYASDKGGRILLAFLSESQTPVGCIALRDITRAMGEWHAKTGVDTFSESATGCRIAEVKRLYTLPAARGHGIGSALVDAVLEAARQEGYDELRLDTLPRMPAAIKLYSKAGFVAAEKYYDTDLEGTIFMKYIVSR
ncbi:putative GNAT family N-acetyltransferase [Mycena amicta]|nr:putative GNAT family N-acetyltransferase [Mycena amicta]